MSMSDPIADMLTRIRNGLAVGKTQVSLPNSKLKQSVADLLVKEGYLTGSAVSAEGSKQTLVVDLKYFQGKPVIDSIKRISRPGLRSYRGKGNIPTVKNGLGIAIVSTSKGLMTDKEARKAGHGGEILCFVS